MSRGVNRTFEDVRLWAEMDKVSKYARPEASDDLRAAEEVFCRWPEVMEARAREARSALAEMLTAKTVILSYDEEGPRRGRYGRLLVYVTVGGVDVNAELVRRGLAVAGTHYPCDRLDEYVTLQGEAQAVGVGLWSASAGETTVPDSCGRP